ncbi:MAG TPA: hypothetical protein VKS22_16285 [Candidatus Binataceae bacterium]|nr:hypothetical protein [Candidatus Binataceae bacterium]
MSESITGLRLANAVDRLEQCRNAMMDAHTTFVATRAAFLEQREAVSQLVQGLEAPDTPATPAGGSAPKQNHRGRPHDGERRVIEYLAAHPRVELDQIVAALAMSPAYLRNRLLPKLRLKGRIVNNLGRWEVVPSALNGAAH